MRLVIENQIMEYPFVKSEIVSHVKYKSSNNYYCYSVGKGKHDIKQVFISGESPKTLIESGYLDASNAIFLKSFADLFEEDFPWYLDLDQNNKTYLLEKIGGDMLPISIQREISQHYFRFKIKANIADYYHTIKDFNDYWEQKGYCPSDISNMLSNNTHFLQLSGDNGVIRFDNIKY